MVGKTWDFQVEVALGIGMDENVAMIARQREARRRRRWTRCCSTPSISSTATRPIPTTRSTASRRPMRQARAGSCCATPTAARCPTRSRRIVGEVAKRIPGDHLGIHCHNDTENAVANSLAAVRAGRAPGAGHPQRARRALRQRQPDLDHADADAQDGLRDRRQRGRAGAPHPYLAAARRAAQPRAQPPRRLCRRGGLRPQGRAPRLGGREGSALLRAHPARSGRQPAPHRGLRPGRPRPT